MQAQDRTLDDMIEKGHGYVIFPNAGKGGLIARRRVRQRHRVRRHRHARSASPTSRSSAPRADRRAGVLRADRLREPRPRSNRFKNNQLNFGANASAVIVKKGVATAATFKDGVAVFVHAQGRRDGRSGVGGQKFTFTPSERQRPARNPSGAARLGHGIRTRTATDRGANDRDEDRGQDAEHRLS